MAELYVFGSVASGDIDPGSDVDLLAVVGETEERGRFPAT